MFLVSILEDLGSLLGRALDRSRAGELTLAYNSAIHKKVECSKLAKFHIQLRIKAETGNMVTVSWSGVIPVQTNVCMFM